MPAVGDLFLRLDDLTVWVVTAATRRYVGLYGVDSAATAGLDPAWLLDPRSRYLPVEPLPADWPAYGGPRVVLQTAPSDFIEAAS